MDEVGRLSFQSAPTHGTYLALDFAETNTELELEASRLLPLCEECRSSLTSSRGSYRTVLLSSSSYFTDKNFWKFSFSLVSVTVISLILSPSLPSLVYLPPGPLPETECRLPYRER